MGWRDGNGARPEVMMEADLKAGATEDSVRELSPSEQQATALEELHHA